MHHCNNQQQNSGISDTPSIDTRKDMRSVVLFCMALSLCMATISGQYRPRPDRMFTGIEWRMSDEAPFETERATYYPVRVEISDEAVKVERSLDHLKDRRQEGEHKIGK